MEVASLRRCFMVIALCLVVGLVGRGNSLPQTKPSDVVLEARRVTRGMGGIQVDILLVRLTNDGKAKWEEYVSITKNRSGSATIPPEEVIAIQRQLDAIDKSMIKPQMGPYGTYTDTVTELSIGLRSGSGVLRFTITNPWRNDSIHNQPLPKDVKSIMCEVWILHAKLAKIPVDSMCDASQKSAK